MPTHNPDCTHGGAHAYTDCRDRSGVRLPMIESPQDASAEPEPSQTAQVAETIVQTEDDALKLLLAAAGNVLKADEPQPLAQ